MPSIKKSVRSSLRSIRYSQLDLKENDSYSLRSKAKSSNSNRKRKTAAHITPPRRHSTIYRRGSEISKSVRDAVGNITQKIRRSTRRRDVPSGENCGPCVPCSADSKSNVMLYSPFNIETPASGKLSGHATTGPVTCVETPTRLRREVEALTANMQALSALTPNTLRNRSTRVVAFAKDNSVLHWIHRSADDHVESYQLSCADFQDKVVFLA